MGEYGIIPTTPRNLSKIQQIYTGSGFNASSSGSGDADSAAFELTAIDPADLLGCNYLHICIVTSNSVTANANTSCDTRLKIETKPIGGAYSDSMTEKSVHSNSAPAGVAVATSGVRTVEWIHTLSNDEKTDGVQVKITGSSSTGANVNNAASIANIQTVIRLAD